MNIRQTKTDDQTTILLIVNVIIASIIKYPDIFNASTQFLVKAKDISRGLQAQNEVEIQLASNGSH